MARKAAVAAQRILLDAGLDEGWAYQKDIHAQRFDLAAQAVEEAMQRVLAGGVAGARDKRCKACDA